MGTLGDKMIRISLGQSALFSVTAIALLGCQPEADPIVDSATAPVGSLPRYFDCLDAAGVPIISAHRGGPMAGYPENALPTFKRTTSLTGALLEVDVTTSADGVLFLHHDDTLNRTTTGSGLAAETSWEKLRTYSLRDTERRVTAYGLTRLDEALEWADGKAILQLDIKRGTDYDDVAEVVKAAGAEARIIPIAYTAGQAFALTRRFPTSMLSVHVSTVDDVERYVDNGTSADRLLAWTGNKKTDPALYQQLDDAGVEVIFGTLGGRSSIDKDIAASGSDDRYQEIVAQGVDVLATDRPMSAFEVLKDEAHAKRITSCGGG